MKATVATYTVSGGYDTEDETGVCVKLGDDTVVDFPFNAGWSEEVQKHRAILLANAMNED